MKSRIKVLYTSDLSTKELLSFESDLEIVVKPFIRVNSTFDKTKLKQFAESYEPERIILTSKNALDGFHQLCYSYSGNLSALVLSKKIADGIKSDLKSMLISEESNVKSIVEQAQKSCSNERLLHLNGNIRKHELKNILEKKGLQIRNYKVYQTELIQPEINISEYSAIVFLSYSGIDSFFSKYVLSNAIPAFTIGENTSQHLRKFYNGQVITSSNSDIETLLQDINEHFSND